MIRILRVLVVDDDAAMRRALQRALSDQGHSVSLALGGAEAIETFHEALTEGAGFDLVLTDLSMKDVDGGRVAAAVKSASPKTRVVIMTGWGRGTGCDPNAIVQADHVLLKPFALRELESLISEWTT